MTRIVMLDGHTVNPGDLSWSALEALGDCRIYARTSSSEVVSRSKGAEIVLTNKTPITSETLARLQALRYIGVLATGFNVVDTAAARSRGIVVTNVPEYGTPSVAQHTWALILELAAHTSHHARSVREGRWSASSDWCYWDRSLIELRDLTLGVIGAGRIGCEVGRIGEAFGMKVRYATRAGGRSELEIVLRSSDVVSLHCPLTGSTHNLMDARTLALMKRSAFLVNTSRGALIDEQALARALNADQLAGAALDVLASEPPAADHPLLAARNFLVTPHLAWATVAARRRLIAAVAENVRAFLAGTAQNVVN